MTKRSGAPCVCPLKHHGYCRPDPDVRFMSRVEPQPDGCWLRPAHTNHQGYALFWFDGKTRAAYRWSYERYVGPIPDGLQVDHVCHNEDIECRGGVDCQHRRCVNPAHLTVATPRENVLAAVNTPASINSNKTHCDRGHPLHGPNLYVCPRGRRECRACRYAATAAFKARQRMRVS